ncbi:endonuclease/exonuclease/phosphatase family protein [Flavisolibacter ginsengisoli]|uniref:Exonuclease III n=1 Tax=Flavisolibacter ginsengisoli DSM 18119 TaxID=1121884 RepID=A0A1M4ZGT7_9BACT|nr:Exonuclease III [Flavisolibacter ginsengisoli DSM 18119]
MRIITWNCNMAFRKKADFILTYNPDILIVPECENPDKLLFSINTPKPTDVLWFGKNNSKGLAIFSYSNFRLTLLENHNQDLQMIIPVAVTDGQFDFNLFAIWANNPTDRDGQYIEQVWKAVQYYSALLKDTKTILVGDFNSNTIWDKKHREGNHSNLVKLLEGRGIFSTYHIYHKQTQGTEVHPTLYMYRHRDKPYHIDYCFASKDLLNKVSSVEVGDFDKWIIHSDHVPVIITFDN